MLPPASLLTDRTRSTLLIVSQVYVPDPASVGQHMHDVAAEMVRRGERVIVLTADSGYDDPKRRYPGYEVLAGVHIVRLPFSSFGKAGLCSRVLGAGIFLGEAATLALSVLRIDQILVSTSPPMCNVLGWTLSVARAIPLTYWVMDLNPDQVVATGKLGPDALLVRSLDWMNRRILARSRTVVALDRFMAERLRAKLPVGPKLVVTPPWPLFEAAPSPDHGVGRAFRAEHDFGTARVVMYSGNLSAVHPVTTLLEAARVLRDRPDLRFVFVGGGAGRAQIEAWKRTLALDNLSLLPYQPLARLHESLSAADVHLVAMGDAMVGIVHPCKVYGAMAVGRPILSLGPDQSHIAELVRGERIGWHVRQGDVEGMVRALREIAEAAPDELERMGAGAAGVIASRLSRRTLLGRFCDLLSPTPTVVG